MTRLLKSETDEYHYKGLSELTPSKQQLLFRRPTEFVHILKVKYEHSGVIVLPYHK